MVRFHSKNASQIVFKEIELCAQNMITILGSIVNLFVVGWGGGNGLYEHKNDHLTSTKIFTLLMNGIFIQALKIMRKVATASIWIC